MDTFESNTARTLDREPARGFTLTLGGAGTPLLLRPGRPDDAKAAGRICHAAFAKIAEAHNFPADFPSEQAATDLMRLLFGHPGFHAVVAEEDGRVVGSNFLDCRDPVAGVGPITVDPAAQNRSVGRRLMEAVHRQARQSGIASVRLVQSAYHTRSLSLYAKLGYAVREPLACMQGRPNAELTAGCTIRPVRAGDLAECNRLAGRVLMSARGGELADAAEQGTARLVERDGRITGYASALGFFGHAVGETNADLAALIATARSIAGPGLLVPMRNDSLFRWCLEHGLRMVQPLTLMSLGPYEAPEGVFLPSILY
jgi:GNAT superfamily N-acetyltransferase